MKETNYKKASAYYLVGNIFNKGISFLTVPIFTRLLSTTDYGIVTTYNSWIAILSMVMGFAIHMGIRAAFIDYEKRVDDFVSVATTFTLLCGSALLLIAGTIFSLFRININNTLIILCLIQGCSGALIQNYSMYLMMQYRYKFRTALMILPNLVSAVLSIIVIKFILSEKLYMGRIVPTSLVYAGFGLFLIFVAYRKSRVVWNNEYLKYSLKISMPLVVHGIALNILSQSDRTMITWLADAGQTGLYSLIYNFSMIALVLTTSLDGVWVPWFTEKLKEGKREAINTRVKDYIILMAAAIIGVVLGGPEVVKLLASEKYWDGISIIPPIVLSNFVVFMYSLYVNVEHFHKKTVYITINTVIAAACNIGLNYMFIPRYGYVAAAFTTLASYTLAFVLHSRYAKRIEPSVYPLKTFVPSTLQVLMAMTVFYLFQDKWLIRWGVLLIYYAMILFLRKEALIEFFPFLGRFMNHKS